MRNSSDKHFRIAYFIDTFPRRTENFILREIAGVSKFWPEMRVYCFHVKPSDWDFVDCGGEAQAVPHASISLPMARTVATHFKWMFRRPLRYLRGLWQTLKMHPFSDFHSLRRFDQAIRLAEQVRRDQVTHLHAHFASEPATVCHLAAKMLGITYSISAHGEDIWARHPFHPVMKEATCCVACTAEGRNHLQNEFPSARVHLVRHGLPSSSTSIRVGITASSRGMTTPLRLVAAGRLIPKKGFDILIKACALLKRNGIEHECEIFGDGELRGALTDEIRRLELGDSVGIRPFVPHAKLRERLSEAHLCVLPSRIDPESGDRDGIPNVLLEAIDSGAVIVAGDLPALREVVKAGVTGFLAAPDSPMELASAIQESLRCERDWPQIRRRACDVLSSDFGFEDNLNRFREIVESSFEEQRAYADI